MKSFNNLVPGQFQMLYVLMACIQLFPALSDNSSSQIFPDLSSCLLSTLIIQNLRFFSCFLSTPTIPVLGFVHDVSICLLKTLTISTLRSVYEVSSSLMSTLTILALRFVPDVYLTVQLLDLFMTCKRYTPEYHDSSINIFDIFIHLTPEYLGNSSCSGCSVSAPS
jgi:hypothetical protein